VATYYLYQQCGADGDVNGGVNGRTGNSAGSTVTGLNNTAKFVIGGMAMKKGVDLYKETGSNLSTAARLLVQEGQKSQELGLCAKQLENVLGMSGAMSGIENGEEGNLEKFLNFLKAYNEQLEQHPLCEETRLSRANPLELDDFQTNLWKTKGVPLQEYERILNLLKAYKYYYIKLGGNTEYLDKYIAECEKIVNIKVQEHIEAIKAIGRENEE